MRCTSCGCPGAYTTFNSISCWNPDCRNFNHDIVSCSEWNGSASVVNGDRVEDVKFFLMGDNEDDDGVPCALKMTQLEEDSDDPCDAD